MRVLLSAYACEPDRGSEPEVGWQRALHMLERADEVWVITRSNNKNAIEANSLSYTPGLHFIYFDLAPWALKLKRQSWFRPVYFVLWQWGAYRLASKLHRANPFESVYHVTFVSLRFGTFMGRLGIPLVIGPIAGGERAPTHLRRSMPIRCKARELLRDLGILLQRVSPLALPAYAAAKHIYVTTPESQRLVPSKWHSKTKVHLAIATPSRTTHRDARQSPDSPRFVFAGRLLYWKGAHFAIRALAETRRKIPEATLTLVGLGPDERRLRDLARESGASDAIEFIGNLPRQQFIAMLRGYTALIFPSLRDSGGFIVLEALSEGLPVVCLDLGGPGIMVNSSCGIVVPSAQLSETQTVTNIANAMTSLATMSTAKSLLLSTGAMVRASELSWSRTTEHIVNCEGLP